MQLDKFAEQYVLVEEGEIKPFELMRQLNLSKPTYYNQKKEMMLPTIPLHGLRYSCTTLLNYLDVNIIDISKVLGHAQTSTTMNIYAHSFKEQKRVASDKIDAFLKENV